RQRLARLENRAPQQSPLGFLKPPTHLVGRNFTSFEMATLIDPAGRPIKAKQEPSVSGGAAPGPAPAPGAAPSAKPPAGRPGGRPPLMKDSDIPTFAADVLDASMEVPIIVDFWAPWCGPCKQLTPLLERAVTEAKGAVRLVKVNTDENPEIAQQLRIQSI